MICYTAQDPVQSNTHSSVLEKKYGRVFQVSTYLFSRTSAQNFLLIFDLTGHENASIFNDTEGQQDINK